MGPSESRSVCYGKLLSASALSIKVTILLLPLTSDEMVCARHQIGAAMVTGKVSVAEGVRKEDQRRELRRERTAATKFL